MEKLVFCKKYKKELPALEGPPYPGPKGKKYLKQFQKKLGWNGLAIKQC